MKARLAAGRVTDLISKRASGTETRAHTADLDAALSTDESTALRPTNDKDAPILETVKSPAAKTALASEEPLESSSPDYSFTSADKELNEALNGGINGGINVGRPVKHCRMLLGAQPPGQEKLDEISVQPPLCDTQLTGAVGLLACSFGKAELPGDIDDAAENKRLQDIARRLRAPPSCTAFLQDVLGMGKIWTALLGNSYYAEHMAPVTRVKKMMRAKYRATLVACPGAPVIDQWAKAIRDQTPDHKLVLMRGGKRPEGWNAGKSDYKWLTPLQHRAGPDSPLFPKRLKRLFDSNNPLTCKTIVLCPYDT
ncbi:hypothetical protein LTR85_000039 [Meristemomyces frigidus]|nr:hypothetical protein LTR85_000039 [Meristemomyces frigidus]